MSEQPITHCEHGIDRAYRCIDCIEAERDALRARVDVLEKERDAIQFKLEGVQCEVGDAFANWRDFQKLATARRAELATLRASIVALAEDWERVAARAPEQVYVTAWQETLAECATKLRQLAEGNSAAAQEGL